MVIIGRAGVGRDDAFNLLLKPDLFISLTKRSEKWAEEINPDVKAVTIPNGVDLGQFNKNLRPAKVDLIPPVIVTSGALVGSKRLEVTIQAVSKLKKKSSLLILGDGPLYEKLNKLGADLLGKERFKILTVPMNEIAPYYLAGKVFTLASVESEAFGNVYLEAMACNLPVVAPDGYRREIIQDAGLFFNSENINDYTYKIDKALSKKFYDLPINTASQFSWDKIVNRYENELNRLLIN